MAENKIRDAAEQEPPPWAAGTENRQHELFPILNEAEIDIVRSYGEEHVFEDSAILWRVGARDTTFHLVLDGKMEILGHDQDGGEPIAIHARGAYSGEIFTMAGHGALVSGRAKGRLRTIAVAQANLRDLLALEAELGEKILLSFILRRMRMMAQHLGDVILVGDVRQRRTASVQEFLSRNGFPFSILDAHDPQASSRLKKYDVSEDDPSPIVICGETKLVQPTTKDIADCLGVSAIFPPDAAFDVAVIGAGPAGLAASVYAASEGLKVVTFERCAVGGQAGSSSRIENYLGFPTGISGQALTGRGYLQAQKFGAEMAIARDVADLQYGKDFHHIVLENGEKIKARSVVIATGAIYRQPQAPRLSEFENTGVHYGASHIQGMLCRNKNVAVVGGGNSAGQAAVYLSSRAKKVSILIRRGSLTDTMSDYLIRRIERTENIELLPHTEVTGIEGDCTIEALVVKNNQNQKETRLNAQHLFVFIGAVPASGFAGDSVTLDEKGFVKTGDALSEEDLKRAGWRLERRPFLLETSAQRVFAVGDIRSGSVKRVASAVGEGSVCVQFIHRALEEAGAAAI